MSGYEPGHLFRVVKKEPVMGVFGQPHWRVVVADRIFTGTDKSPQYRLRTASQGLKPMQFATEEEAQTMAAILNRKVKEEKGGIFDREYFADNADLFCGESEEFLEALNACWRRWYYDEKDQKLPVNEMYISQPIATDPHIHILIRLDVGSRCRNCLGTRIIKDKYIQKKCLRCANSYRIETDRHGIPVDLRCY